MTAITRCPTCATQFKVAPEQLRVSEGWVRCGRCNNIFDATDHLVANGASLQAEPTDDSIVAGSAAPSAAAPPPTTTAPPHSAPATPQADTPTNRQQAAMQALASRLDQDDELSVADIEAALRERPTERWLKELKDTFSPTSGDTAAGEAPQPPGKLAPATPQPGAAPPQPAAPATHAHQGQDPSLAPVAASDAHDASAASSFEEEVARWQAKHARTQTRAPEQASTDEAHLVSYDLSKPAGAAQAPPEATGPTSTPVQEVGALPQAAPAPADSTRSTRNAPAPDAPLRSTMPAPASEAIADPQAPGTHLRAPSDRKPPPLTSKKSLAPALKKASEDPAPPPREAVSKRLPPTTTPPSPEVSNRPGGKAASAGSIPATTPSPASGAEDRQLADLDAAPPADADEALLEEYRAAFSETQELSFVRKATREAFWQRTGVKAACIAIALLLLAALALQAAFTHRHSIAARSPAMKAQMERLCGLLSCTIAPLQAIDRLVLEGSTFQAEGADTFTLSWSVRNRGTQWLQTPNLSLSLRNDAGETLIRRTLAPADIDAPAELAPGQVWQGRQVLQIHTHADAVTGYQLQIFYPAGP